MELNIIKLIENKIEEFKKTNDKIPTKLYLPRYYEEDIFILLSETGKSPDLSGVYGFREEIRRNHNNKFKNLEVIWDAEELKVG